MWWADFEMCFNYQQTRSDMLSALTLLLLGNQDSLTYIAAPS